MSQITVFVEDSGDRTSDFKSFSAEVNVPESPDCSSLSKTTSDRNALLKRFSNDIFADTSCESEFPSVSITNKNPFDGKIINFVPLASSACGGREFVAKKVGKIRTDIISMRAELSKWKVAKRNKKIDFIQRQTSFTHSVNQTILASESDTEEEESEESSSSSDESEAEKDSTASESDSSVFSNHKRKSKRAALSDSEDTDDTAESNDTSQTSEEDTSVRKPKCRKVLDFSQASDDARDDGDDLLDDIFELTQLKEFKPKLNLDDLNSHPGEVVLNAYYYAYSKAKKVSERKKLPIPACKNCTTYIQNNATNEEEAKKIAQHCAEQRIAQSSSEQDSIWIFEENRPMISSSRLVSYKDWEDNISTKSRDSHVLHSSFRK